MHRVEDRCEDDPRPSLHPSIHSKSSERVEGDSFILKYKVTSHQQVNVARVDPSQYKEVITKLYIYILYT